MNIKRKKLIAREILWFGFFCVTTFLIIGTLFIPVPYRGIDFSGLAVWLLSCEWIYDVGFVRFVIILASLYLFRGIVWAIQTLWFSEKKQTKD